MNGAEEVIFTYGNYAVKAIVTSEGQIATYIYTTAGSQIFKLIDSLEVNLDYLKKVLKSISNDNVRFQVYKITKWNSDNDFEIDEKDVLDILP